VREEPAAGRAGSFLGSFMLLVGLLLAARAVLGRGEPGPDSSISPDWLTRVSARIHESVYPFPGGDDCSLSAPNRSHGLRVRVVETGIEVASRTRGSDPGDGGWLPGLRLAGRDDEPRVERPAAGTQRT